MSANDAIQRVAEAIAAIIEQSPAVQAVTDRLTENIVRYGARTPTAEDRGDEPDTLAYLVTEARPRVGSGENWDVDVVLQAEAATATDANALLTAAVSSLSQPAFEAVGADAVILEPPTMTNPPDDGGDPSTNPAAVIAEATFTVWITL